MEKYLPQTSELQTLSREQLVNTLFHLLDENGQPVSLDAQGQLPHRTRDIDMIPLKEWALMNGISPATARQKAGRGALRTAKKVGRDWMISRYEPNVDHRFKDGLPALEGPIHIDEVLNYLLLSDPSMLPERLNASNAHKSYFKTIFTMIRNSLSGNEKILFSLLCDAMEISAGSGVCFVSHEEVFSNLSDEAFDDETFDTVDYSDYLHVLSNTIHDMLRTPIELNTGKGLQTILLPWYKSLSWKKDKNDGIYFIPSDFFRLIFYGLQ